MRDSVALAKLYSISFNPHIHRKPRARPVSDAGVTSEFATGWSRLAARIGSPMQHPIWARAYADAFSNSDKVWIMYVGPPSAPALVVPLFESGGLSSRLELLGSRHLFEPMDFLCSDPSAFGQFARAVADMGRPARFARIPAGSPAIAAFRNAYASGWVRTTPAAGCPYIELSDKWREPEGCFTSDWRSALRRARRRAAEMGGITCEVLTPTPEQCPAVLDKAFRVEAASWKRDHGSALMVDKIRGSFFRRLAELASRAAMLRVCFLYVGADVAAMQIAVEQGNRFYLMKIGYDEKYARCSPGTLLLLETIKYAASRGLSSYEFLGNNEDWIQRWTKLSRPTVSLSAYPRAWKGAAAIVSDARRAVLRRLRLSVQGRLSGAPAFLRGLDAVRWPFS